MLEDIFWGLLFFFVALCLVGTILYIISDWMEG